jgi:hypothetical protein
MQEVQSSREHGTICQCPRQCFSVEFKIGSTKWLIGQAADAEAMPKAVQALCHTLGASSARQLLIGELSLVQTVRVLAYHLLP